MTAEIYKTVAREQKRLSDRTAVENDAYAMVDAFCAAANEAAGNPVLQCGWVHDRDRKRSISITNMSDVRDVVLARAAWGIPALTEKRTACYKITFGNVRNGFLARTFLNAAAEAPAIGVSHNYVHIDAGGSHRSLNDGCLTPVPANGGVGDHAELNWILAHIYGNLPEHVRGGMKLKP